MAEQSLVLRGIVKRFGLVTAVNSVDLGIDKGEFFALLGPSGSGKTTLLRIIAGLETPDEGSVVIAGQDVTLFPPYARRIGMVFQDFLLWPHMTIAENIKFPLQMQGMSAAETRERVSWVINFVHLETLEERFPHQLSGGQKQRVALARGLVARPVLLLLDEPLANLDRELRREMEVEVRRFQVELGIPFIYVTHNQEEALTMSDRIAVMNGGSIEQIGPKLDVYRRPTTRFVASFVGSANLLRGQVVAIKNGLIRLEWRGMEILAPRPAGALEGSTVDYFIKGERIKIASTIEAAQRDGENALRGRLRDVIFKGHYADYFVTLENDAEVVISGPAEVLHIRSQDAVTITWDPAAGESFLAPAEDDL